MAGSQQEKSRPTTGARSQVSGDAHAPHHQHGNSVAAWTCVSIIMIATLVMALAVVFPSVALFVVGAVLVPVALVVGRVLSAMGFGTAGKTEH